jgi:hypothetical protein
MRVFETVHAEPRISIEAPGFRVNFWQRQSPESAWSLEAFVLTDVQDVYEALRWAEEHAQGRQLEVFAEVDGQSASQFDVPRTTALLRLLGSDPNAGVSVEVGPFARG